MIGARLAHVDHIFIFTCSWANLGKASSVFSSSARNAATFKPIRAHGTLLAKATKGSRVASG